MASTGNKTHTKSDVQICQQFPLSHWNAPQFQGKRGVSNNISGKSDFKMCVELHTLDLMMICIIHVHMYLYNMYMYVNRLNLTQGASPIRTGTTLGHAILIHM